MKSFLMMGLLFTTTLFAAGERGGNGGGGFCYDNGKCVTLAEAGLRIPRGEINLFMISEEIEVEIKRIVSILPLSQVQKKALVKNAVGERNTFMPIEQSDAKKYKKILKSYQQLIRQYAPRLPSDEFVLYAVSEQEASRTYLLPSFFDLGLQQQALLLLHEANVRNRPSGVITTAIQWDGMVDDFLHHPDEASTVNFLVTHHELNFSESDDDFELFRNLNTYFSKEIGRPMRLSDYCDYEPLWPNFCGVSREAAFKGQKNINSQFAKLFYEMALSITKVYGAEYLSAEPLLTEQQMKSACIGSEGENIFFQVTKGEYTSNWFALLTCSSDGRPTILRRFEVRGISKR